jgi:hypothetical protein
MKKLAYYSNRYCHKHILPKYLNKHVYGHVWKDITVAEMYHFLGIILKISLNSLEFGGYTVYWRENNHNIRLKNGQVIELQGTTGWAKDIMPLWRFKQIRIAFHSADKQTESGGSGDKCYMLCTALENLNQASRNTFVLGY